ERDLLYKVLFDMKQDLNDLKQFVLHMAEANHLKTDMSISAEMHDQPTFNELSTRQPQLQTEFITKQPVVINPANSAAHAHVHEEVEESLSLIDKEKELINKALSKHRGKRKDAAMDLGISERTLYRKIKEYNLDE
ncbi:MAG TPA: helix-turn-helix domain-containing protein, partial [Chitinophagales bacterium]|nr:helix-turn-helix domain-containing protein [Chitinophagales bacterium]